MRCKYCDKRLEPSQYKWDAEAKEFKETCEGRCVLGNTPFEVDGTPGDGDDLVVKALSEDDGGIEDVVNTWVPED